MLMLYNITNVLIFTDECIDELEINDANRDLYAKAYLVNDNGRTPLVNGWGMPIPAGGAVWPLILHNSGILHLLSVYYRNYIATVH